MTIFGSHKGLAAARLQRWAIFLVGYQYKLEFRSTTQYCNADYFFRLFRDSPENTELGSEREATLCNLHKLEMMPVNPKQLAEATTSDKLLNSVLRYCRDGWPDEVPTELQPYYQKKDELSIESNCLFKGTQVIAPTSLQQQELAELHIGLVRMKGVARVLLAGRASSEGVCDVPNASKSACSCSTPAVAMGYKALGKHPCGLCRASKWNYVLGHCKQPLKVDGKFYLCMELQLVRLSMFTIPFCQVWAA